MTSRLFRFKEFTGWHMAAVMAAFFGTIITVNTVMAIYANTSWTGLVVQNAYVAGLQFNEKAEAGRAQAALGWKDELKIGSGMVRFTLADASGSAIHAKGVTVALRRPAYEAEDETFKLDPLPGGAFEAAHAVRDGIWIVEVDADVGEPLPYRVVRRVVVKDGALE